MVQKSGDQHLGCIKPCKQWDQLPTSTGPLVHDFFHQQYQSNCSFNSTSYEKRHRLGTRNTSIWVNIVQEDLDFIPSTWTTTSLFPDTSATHNLPLIFPFRTNPNLFSNCESNKKNFQQKKLSSPTSLTSLFLSPSSCRSRGRSARTSDDQRHDRATSGRPARCRCLQWADQNLSTNSAKLSHRVMKREILCLYCLLFMIFMIVECFSRKKTSSSKTVGHLYGNENSYLNLNHHFGGTWHD